jgi:hypothetical protein
MPYKSLAQERYFNANKSKLEKQGVNVNEWNKASKGMKFENSAKDKKLDKKMGYKEGSKKDNALDKKYTGKGTRARLNTAAGKMLFSKRSK